MYLSSTAGYIMDKYLHLQHLFLFAFTILTGTTVLLYPNCGHIYGFFVLTFFQGIMFGALETGETKREVKIFFTTSTYVFRPQMKAATACASTSGAG